VDIVHVVAPFSHDMTLRGIGSRSSFLFFEIAAILRRIRLNRRARRPRAPRESWSGVHSDKQRPVFACEQGDPDCMLHIRSARCILATRECEAHLIHLSSKWIICRFSLDHPRKTAQSVGRICAAPLLRRG